MKKSFFPWSWFTFIALIASGCSPTTPTDAIGSAPVHHPHAKSEEPSEPFELSFLIDAKTITIPVEKIASVKQYLDQRDPQERMNEFSRIQTETFSSPSGVVYGDIRYGCGVKQCDHTLVQIKNDSFQSLPLHSGSIWVRHAFSPNEKNLAILLGRNEGTEVLRNSLLIIDADSFRLAEIQNADELASQLTAPEFLFPIVSMSWENDRTLKATIPDTEDVSFDALQEWKQGEHKTKEVYLQMKSHKKEAFRQSESFSAAWPKHLRDH